MKTKLKKLLLSSVDAVRAGANQEADICLFKSADGAEAPAQEIPIDDSTFLTYSDALAKSILSIQGDETLDEAAKADMIQKSFEQFNAAVEKAKSIPEQDPIDSPEESSDGPVVEDPVPDYDLIKEIESKKA